MTDLNVRAKSLEKSLHTVLFELLKTKSGLLLLLFLLIGAGLIFWSTNFNILAGDVWGGVLFAIGTSFIATAIFTATQLTLTSRENALFVQSILEIHFQSFEDSILDKISKRQAFTPTDIYQSGNDSNPLFKIDMLEDLSKSSTFYFKGITGKYAASQILESNGDFEKIIIVLPSISNAAINERARGRLNSPDQKGVETQRKRLIEDTILGLVGLFSKVKFSSRKITISITDLIFIDRYEITDTSLYLQMFDDKTRSNRHKFPTAFRFISSSPIYHHYKREFLSLVETCDNKYELTSNSTQDEYFSFLENNYNGYFNRDNFNKLEAEFDEICK